MTEPKRILHIVPGLPIGGAERMLQDVVQSVGPPDAMHTIFNLQEQGPMQADLERAGARIVSGRMGHWRQALPGLRILRRTVRDVAPDIVHGWMYAGNLAASAAQQWTGAPSALVWSMHSVAPFWPGMGRRQHATSHANRMLSARADAIIYAAESSAQAHAAAGFSTKRACLVPGGVDTARFRPHAAAREALRARLGVSGDTPLIGMVARYHPMKRHDVFVAAANLLLESRRAELPCHMVLVGEGLGDVPGGLRAHISTALAPRLHFLGPTSDPAPIVQGLDVCVLSSAQEALPKALLEAMATKVLCVATAVGDVPALLDGVGWVVPAGSAQALAHAMGCALDCMGPEAQRRREAGRDRIDAAYSQRQFAEAMRDLYRRLGAAQ